MSNSQLDINKPIPSDPRDRGYLTGSIGSISGTSVAKQDSSKMLTHIEIRRAQNGFVVRGIQGSVEFGHSGVGNTVFFVCETVESLTNLISSLATDEGEFVWACGSIDFDSVFKEKL